MGLKKICSTGIWILLFIMSGSVICPAYGQSHAQKPARILFLLDASSSMLNEWKGTENRFHAASRVIGAIADSIHVINSDVAFALRVYGNQYSAQDKNCYDSEGLKYLSVMTMCNGSRHGSGTCTRWAFHLLPGRCAQTAENDFIRKR